MRNYNNNPFIVSMKQSYLLLISTTIGIPAITAEHLDFLNHIEAAGKSLLDEGDERNGTSDLPAPPDDYRPGMALRKACEAAPVLNPFDPTQYMYDEAQDDGHGNLFDLDTMPEGITPQAHARGLKAGDTPPPGTWPAPQGKVEAAPELVEETDNTGPLDNNPIAYDPELEAAFAAGAPDYTVLSKDVSKQVSDTASALKR